MQKKYWLLVLLLVAFTACGDGGDITPAPDEDDNGSSALNLDNCSVEVSGETLEIATWNIENYPQSNRSSAYVEQIVEAFDLDVIAVQEITSEPLFQSLVNDLDGWNGFVTRVNGGNQMVGYLYKTSEITVVGQAQNLFSDDTDEYNNAFTSYRRPYLLQIRHSSGFEAYLINVHLKCCGGSEDRRRNASVLLKTYIDDNLADENVIVLGDFNDEIVDAEDNVFQNFIDDSDNFEFATMEIASGPNTEWSYPSWPSHLDQILITNELFDNEISTTTIKVDQCVTDFSNTVSDHRPVLIKLSTN